MVMSRLVSREIQDFPSQKKHVAFKLSPKCSQQDPFPFLLEKLGIFKMRANVLVWRGGRGRLLPDLMELSAFLECLVRSLSGARL